ncbi:uncharacterized protein LOC143036824 [Oratosquilla oratoria]|uniref:uncharacterized protein LOC143036824 n=1 Tax=Oratosquilla oratoria TaxID=337810 RepID=UPI003F769A2F
MGSMRARAVRLATSWWVVGLWVSVGVVSGVVGVVTLVQPAWYVRPTNLYSTGAVFEVVVSSVGPLGFCRVGSSTSGAPGPPGGKQASDSKEAKEDTKGPSSPSPPPEGKGAAAGDGDKGVDSRHQEKKQEEPPTGSSLFTNSHNAALDHMFHELSREREEMKKKKEEEGEATGSGEGEGEVIFTDADLEGNGTRPNSELRLLDVDLNGTLAGNFSAEGDGGDLPELGVLLAEDEEGEVVEMHNATTRVFAFNFTEEDLMHGVKGGRAIVARSRPERDEQGLVVPSPSSTTPSPYTPKAPQLLCSSVGVGVDMGASAVWGLVAVLYGCGGLGLVVTSLVAVPCQASQSPAARFVWASRLANLQAAAVMSQAVGLTLFPLGLGSPLARRECGLSASVYWPGDCRVGWCYVLALVCTTLAAYCPVLARLTAYKRYTVCEWSNLSFM